MTTIFALAIVINAAVSIIGGVLVSRLKAVVEITSSGVFMYIGAIFPPASILAVWSFLASCRKHVPKVFKTEH